MEVLINPTCGSRHEVDGPVARALAAGRTTDDVAEDYGFNYTRSFFDPDRHGWGLLHLTDPPLDP